MMRPIFALFTFLFLFHPNSALCAGGNDSSQAAGILKHGEHFADLILGQLVNSVNTRHLEAFTAFTDSLVRQAMKGKLDVVNEKIDGSPAIVLGFKDGKPFVAYKGGFDRKGKQVLFTTIEDVVAEYPKSVALQLTYGNLVRELLEVAKTLPVEFQNYVFQGDLLFSADADEAAAQKMAQIAAGTAIQGPYDKPPHRQIDESGTMSIKANALEYSLGPKHPLYSRLTTSKVGVVFHTVGRKSVGENMRVDSSSIPPQESETLVRKFNKTFLSSTNVFVTDPFQDGVSLATKGSSALAQDITFHLDRLNTHLAPVLANKDFQTTWEPIQEKLRVFFNAELNPPKSGGFYESIQNGNEVSATELWQRFQKWLPIKAGFSKTYGTVKNKVKALDETQQALAVNAIEAYLDAVRIHYLLQSSVESGMKSKFGGGEIEGFMLRHLDTVVKFVDRMKFTLINNLKNRASKPLNHSGYPYPFNEWRPGSIYFVMKAQPPHAGHIELIKTIAQKNPGQKVYVLVSSKVPDLNAATIGKMGIQGSEDSVIDVKDGKYTYVFDAEFRKSLVEKGVRAQSNVEVVVADIQTFWSHLSLATELELQGKILFPVGEKEIQEGRYDDRFEANARCLDPLAIDLKQDGISGTSVRLAIHKYVTGPQETMDQARQELRKAFSYIDASERESTIDAVVSAYRKVHEAVASKLPKPKVPKKSEKADPGVCTALTLG